MGPSVESISSINIREVTRVNIIPKLTARDGLSRKANCFVSPHNRPRVDHIGLNLEQRIPKRPPTEVSDISINKRDGLDGIKNFKIDCNLLTIMRNNIKGINIETSKNPNKRNIVFPGIRAHKMKIERSLKRSCNGIHIHQRFSKIDHIGFMDVTRAR